MPDAIIGISDHGGWAILVTTDPAGQLLDRRRVTLVDDDLPKIPHHHEAKSLPIDEAIALIGRVQKSAELHAEIALAEAAKSIAAADPSIYIRGIALRQCPPLASTIAERITSVHARNNADWVMYRQALATAAHARKWQVHWFDARKVEALAANALGLPNLTDHSARIRRAAGPPWTQDHKLALALGIAALA